MWLPKLNYYCRSGSVSEAKSLRCFLDRTLPLHRAPVIESFPLNLSNSYFKPEDIKLLVVIALSRYLREFEISYYACLNNPLPSSLYTCKSLVTLKLDGNILLDVPRMVGLPSLKTLQLEHVKCLDGGSLPRLLSICPVLEDLLVKFRGCTDNMGMIIFIGPSLQSLSLRIPFDGLLDGLLIDTPSLRYFKVEDQKKSSHSYLVENMPKLREAYICRC